MKRSSVDESTRRDFMTRLARTCLGVSFLPPASLAYALEQKNSTSSEKASQVIYLFMRGGMSHVDTFDTKPDAPAGIQGPVRTIKTQADGVRFSGYLEELAKHANKFAIINSMTHTQGAHEQGVYKVHTGYEQGSTLRYPALGSWVAKQVPKTHGSLPPYIRFGGLAGHPGSGFLDARYAPVPVLDPAKGIEHTQPQESDSMTALRKRADLATQLNASFLQKYNLSDIRVHAETYTEAIKLMKSDDLNVFDLTTEKQKLVNDYGQNSFGQGLLLARRLVERGTNFVEVELGGWDTHDNNFGRVEELCKIVDRGVSTLLQDLEDRGLLRSTLVVLTTEFGRSPEITGGGRNHHPIAFSSFIAGGGVKGGQIYGKTDPEGAKVVENPASVADFHATIGSLLGISPAEHVTVAGGEFSIYGGTGAKRGVPIASFV
ncbi:DUF1501 domain-containing protein [soil metagenome]